MEPMVHTDSRDEFSDRLREALRQANQDGHGMGARLARVARVTPKAASKWLNGEARPGHDKKLLLCKWLNVREEWLDYGRGAMRPEDHGYQVNEPIGGIDNAKPTDQPPALRRYPVITSIMAGSWGECVVPYPAGAEDKVETTAYEAQGDAFWLEVEGDSMTAPPGVRPSLPEGTLVLFDPGIEAAPGKLVAAQLDDSNVATFKKLIEDGGKRYLKALNPAYPLIPINGNCRIVGVAVEAKTLL